MQNKHLWITVAALSAAVICWGLWITLRPDTATQPAESLQSILMEHVEYLPEVYRAHGNYTLQLQNDSCTLIYRYSSTMCTPCYLEDLFNLDEFGKTVGRNKVLVLPAYHFNDRNSRMRINSETRGLAYRNIPSDSLALPIHAGEGEKRYFAVVDTRGQVGMVFFPVKGRRDLTQRYFREIAGFFPSQTVAKKDSVAVAP